MPRAPYHIARQEHLGDALDGLMARGALRWRWEYDLARSRALYHVAIGDEPERTLHTADAEQVVSRCFDALGEKWLPVPPPVVNVSATKLLAGSRTSSPPALGA